MKFFWLLLFTVVTCGVFYVFVHGQWYLVSSTKLFVALIVIFVGLSFFASASETAFSTAHTDVRIQEALREEFEGVAARYNDFEEVIRNVGLQNLDKHQKRKWMRVERDQRKLKRKEDSLGETSRAVYVGSFASLSVFLNIALAACLPFALVSDPGSVPLMISTPYPVVGNASLSYEWLQLDIGGQQVLIFFASAFPILVLGKVVPKEIGAIFNMFFAYRMNPVARKVAFVMGPIPKAMSWPLELLRTATAKDRD
ncbi:hypothetical protein PARPLA_00878 [Rhodobacteraceae bacterium THAF1]|nr:hypothetical protein FIU81_00635 [Palleronia sp. THAF1]VDC19979.1 hypothetical protein PARPLA_00878 [Rhodobacteraceae bacterium THAF1]